MKPVPSAKADSTFPLCFPGTYVPGYLDAAATRLVRGLSPLTVIITEFRNRRVRTPLAPLGG